MENERFKELNDKQRAFAEEFVLNGCKGMPAYMKAYGVSAASAAPSSTRLLKKPLMREYITTLQKQAYEAQFITAERVAMKLAEIAFSDKNDEAYNASAQLKALDLLQKQLNLQQQQINADVTTKGNIVINIDDDN